jgi:hypothetical protein
MDSVRKLLDIPSYISENLYSSRGCRAKKKKKKKKKKMMMMMMMKTTTLC